MKMLARINKKINKFVCVLKSIKLIINMKTILLSIVSILSTYICVVYNATGDFPLTLVSLVIFPIVFSIGGAYTRRENALKHYGAMKAHGRAIYLASRDWVSNQTDEEDAKIKQIMLNLLASCRELFHNSEMQIDDREKEVYSFFSELSIFIKEFRNRGMNSGEVSRANAFLSKMFDSFENMKHIYQYRTPVTLRAYSKVFIYLMPILFAPYFAHLVLNESTTSLAYIMPVFLTFILVSLDNIQDHLENPFDQVGEDDIKINAEKFIESLDF
jgi:predicted membrane chloride channel (bestrophin family)